MDLERVENELKKRIIHPYKWGRKQSNDWDIKTNFIYTTYSFKRLIQQTDLLNQDLKDYALNRWYNYWSAMAAESIFETHRKVTANKNKYDKLVDFKINNIPFDHKTTVFPKGFNKSFDYAINHKKELITWLYNNQSQEGRKHLKNRLFLILYDKKNQNHWKLKSEIVLLKTEIDKYVIHFSKDNLIKLNFGKGDLLSDIIWVKNE